MRQQIIKETKHENEAETGFRPFMNQIHVFATYFNKSNLKASQQTLTTKSSLKMNNRKVLVLKSEADVTDQRKW